MYRRLGETKAERTGGEMSKKINPSGRLNASNHRVIVRARRGKTIEKERLFTVLPKDAVLPKDMASARQQSVRHTTVG